MEVQKARRARFVFLLWLVIAIVYFSLAADFVGASMRDTEFEEYLKFAVQLVGSQQRTTRELRQLIVAKAEELRIPLDPARVDVRGYGSELQASVSYSVLIELPFLASASFHKEFKHEVDYTTPR